MNKRTLVKTDFDDFKAKGDNTNYTPNEYLWKDDELMHTGKACHVNCWKLIKDHYGITLKYNNLGNGIDKRTINHYKGLTYGNFPGDQYGYEHYSDDIAYMWKDPLKNQQNRDRILGLQFPFLH